MQFCLDLCIASTSRSAIENAIFSVFLDFEAEDLSLIGRHSHESMISSHRNDIYFATQVVQSTVVGYAFARAAPNSALFGSTTARQTPPINAPHINITISCTTASLFAYKGSSHAACIASAQWTTVYTASLWWPPVNEAACFAIAGYGAKKSSTKATFNVELKTS